MPLSVKGLLNDTQVQLEKAGTDKFGSVVDTFSKDLFNKSTSLPTTAPNTAKVAESNAARKDGSWYATSYAAALAGGTSFRPKLKFLFKVSFEFTPEAIAIEPSLKKSDVNDFTFMVKSVERPKVDFEYEEDLNMYNFRTKALKKIRHRDLTIVFTDDAGNRVFNFVRALMKVHSPITNTQSDRDNTLDPPNSTNAQRGFGSGMAFNRTNKDTSHRAVVNSQFGNSIKTIRVQQIYTDPSASMANTAKMVSFDFINPRVVSFDFDELSHEANDVSTMTMLFDYDWMEMVDVGVLNGAKVQSVYDESKYTILAPGAAGTMGAPADLSPTPNAGGSAAGGGKGNVVTNILGGVIGKGAQQLSSDLIGRAVRTVAGNSRIGQALGGQITSSFAGPIGGLVSGAARDKIASGLSSISNPFARTSPAPVADSAGGGQVVAGVTSAPTPGGGS